MKPIRVGISLGAIALGVVLFAPRPVVTQSLPRFSAIRPQTVAPSSLTELRAWDTEVTRMRRDGTLQLVRERDDTLLPARQHERFAQYHRGLPIFGAEVTRQSENGVPISMLGTVYRDIDLSTTPDLSADAARDVMLGQSGAQTTLGDPELLILPLDAGGLALAYRIVTAFPQDVLVSFVDAASGRILLQFTDLQSQAGAGLGHGVLGDQKKISTNRAGTTYQASDGLRPPAIQTYDLKGNLTRVQDILAGRATLGTADLGTDTDNDWTDGPTVDAHVYAGWTYDYYFKRFGRRGLDNSNLAMRSIVHPVNKDSASVQFISQNSLFFNNAFWSGTLRIMVYGEGLPANITSGGKSWNFTAGALDVVAHELTHGVTQFSSNLTYLNESGALNEAFSDIMATGAEFFFQTAGSGSLMADYQVGEDVISGGGLRSLANPLSFGQPDHYSVRYIGINDGGGVHTNSMIPGHVFYLAVEGGSNRTSGLSVQGVGAANRDQIEKVFYRAFTMLLPANANFFVARTATIQSARDLYGTNSAAERAVTQAWDAVGVRGQAATLTFVFDPNPVPAAPVGQCTLARPNFVFAVGVAEVSGIGFTVASSQIRFYNAAGALTSTSTLPPFAQFFTACGPGNNRIAPNSLPCASLCVSLNGATGGFVDFTVTGTDDVGNAATFASPRLRLGAATTLTTDEPDQPGICIPMLK